ELLAEAREIALHLREGQLTDGERVIEQPVARLQHLGADSREVDHEPVLVDLLGLDPDLEFPGVSVKIDTRAVVSANVIREVDVDAATYAGGSGHLACMADIGAGGQRRPRRLRRRRACASCPRAAEISPRRTRGLRFRSGRRLHPGPVAPPGGTPG